MTFDEAITNFEQEANDFAGLVPMETIYEIILDLRDKYAPTVEMTKDKVKELNSIVHEVGEEFEQDELPDDIRTTDKMIELESGFVLLKDLNVILHPETIKIVDE
ncbi:hypothetical protein DQM10_06895 [Leuconostoc mesenteroides subsp. mesenteroides]|uniref:hypothetical protein n=1 Tax=Leuconostoc mesenteroides TaxID=1245 RepID=UPI000E093E22|nr:hypothetical protein [Leuconostoc mesenteroides]RDF88661.1 hypothetical protein DQM10_06895 [Leuconostoc mesenteroides subsp. mesenteroides]